MKGTVHKLVVLFGVAACGDDDGGGPDAPPSTELVCGTGTSGALPVAVTDAAGQDLVGAAVDVTPGTTAPASVSIACAPDIVPAGFVALGPAVTFSSGWSDRPFEVTLPFKATRLPTGAGNRHVRVVAKRASGDAFFPAIVNRTVDATNPSAARVSFRAGELTTYQVVAATDAGQPRTERFGWNALVGISMGGNAAMTIAMRHPERFDSFADLGGEPGASTKYFLVWARDHILGGFCTEADEAAGRGAVGTLCPAVSKRTDQFELTADYEHQIAQAGEGVGLTLRRSLYQKGFRDMARALTNPAIYDPTTKYAPPGVDAAFLALPAAERCANPRVLADFYDAEFNSDGSHPVITFCDGGDSERLGLAVFDPTLPQTDPAELLLAVDLNANGRRDAGEPVIANAAEPWRDVGVDGIASASEPGYDAASNPDPAGDDYHWQRNPRGTEGNDLYETGEPFDDVGLDGVADTCQVGTTPPSGVAGCYDFGEADGTWTISPNAANWYEHDAVTRYLALTPAQRAHMAMYFDGGIRDFLNSAVAANEAVGVLSGVHGVDFAVTDGFAPLALDGTVEPQFDALQVDWSQFPRNAHVRYGNPDATEQQIMNGDGRHVGTATQLIDRATTSFSWMDKRWPGGDRSPTLASGEFVRDVIFTASNGRESPYAVFLPPGYADLPDQRFPVIYFLHGYGQEPADLVDLSAIFSNYMLSDQPEAQRFQKFIIVYVDGRCRPGTNGVPTGAVGDRCEQGTFYTDANNGGTAQMETMLLELMDYIDATYRTKQPSDEEVTP